MKEDAMIRVIVMVLAALAAGFVYIDDRRYGWKDPRWSFLVFLIAWPWVLGTIDLVRELWRYILIGAGLR